MIAVDTERTNLCVQKCIAIMRTMNTEEYKIGMIQFYGFLHTIVALS